MRVNTSRGVLAGQEYTEAWVLLDGVAGPHRFAVQVDHHSEVNALRALRNRLREGLEGVIEAIELELRGER